MKSLKLITKKIEVREDGEFGFKKGRMHLFLDKESVLENFLLRATGCDQHPVKLFKKDIIPEIKKQLKINDKIKFSWSRKAGCSCGCSPGFIIDSEEYRGKNIFVDYDIIKIN